MNDNQKKDLVNLITKKPDYSVQLSGKANRDFETIYFDTDLNIYRKKPETFIEVYTVSDNKIAYQGVNYGIEHLETILKSTEKMNGAKTSHVWLIRKKLSHSKLYLTYLQSKNTK